MEDDVLNKLYLVEAERVEKEENEAEIRRETIYNRLFKLELLCKKGIVLKPDGMCMFFKRCPKCHSKLRGKPPYGDWKWLLCTHCDYEWVECLIGDPG